MTTLIYCQNDATMANLWSSDGLRFNGNMSVFWGVSTSVFADPRFIPLAVSSPLPLILHPNVPTMKSLGVPFVDGVYHAFAVPNAVTPDLCEKISNTLKTIHDTAAYQLSLVQQDIIASSIVYGRDGAAISHFSSTLLQRYQDLYYPVVTLPPIINATIVTIPPVAVASMLTMSALGIIASTLVTSYVVKYRSHPVLIAASVPFCLLMLAGCLLAYISLMVLTMLQSSTSDALTFGSQTSSRMCRAFPFLLGISFYLIFAPLFAKTRRLVGNSTFFLFY